jgi:hypothetical protein
MLGVGDMKVQGPAAAGIAQVVQHPPAPATTSALGPTEGAASPPVVPAPILDPRWRKVLHPSDPFGRIRHVLPGAVHDRAS